MLRKKISSYIHYVFLFAKDHRRMTDVGVGRASVFQEKRPGAGLKKTAIFAQEKLGGGGGRGYRRTTPQKGKKKSKYASTVAVKTTPPLNVISLPPA